MKSFKEVMKELETARGPATIRAIIERAAKAFVREHLKAK